MAELSSVTLAEIDTSVGFGVPANAMLREDGTPMVREDGSYLLRES